MDGIKFVDPTFTPAGVVWANGVPVVSTYVMPLWFEFGFQDTSPIRQGLMGVVGVGAAAACQPENGGHYTPNWGPIPRPRRPDGKLVIPGLDDGDPELSFGPEMSERMRVAWTNFVESYLELVRAYGEEAP